MKYLSKTTVIAGAVLFALGILRGESMNHHRSATVETHVAGSNAITLHIALAIILVGAIVISIFYRVKAPNKPYSFWAAPFTTNALERAKNTLLFRRGFSITKTLRAVVVAFLLLTMAFYFYRAGMQVLGSADPSFTINAWGGPSRWGASLAHWMDAIYLFYIEAGLAALFALGAQTKRPKQAKKRFR